jgi:hypothetical protein
VPKCYLLALTSGSSLDQQSNNITLFNLVEQLNLAPNTPPPPPGAVLPLEVHAYFKVAPSETNVAFEVRFALVAETGLETCSEPITHRAVTPRYRTRTMGLPLPPVTGQYELRLDWRPAGIERWTRDLASWPLAIVEVERRPAITH